MLNCPNNQVFDIEGLGICEVGLTGKILGLWPSEWRAYRQIQRPWATVMTNATFVNNLQSMATGLRKINQPYNEFLLGSILPTPQTLEMSRAFHTGEIPITSEQLERINQYVERGRRGRVPIFDESYFSGTFVLSAFDNPALWGKKPNRIRNRLSELNEFNIDFATANLQALNIPVGSELHDIQRFVQEYRRQNGDLG